MYSISSLLNIIAIPQFCHFLDMLYTLQSKTFSRVYHAVPTISTDQIFFICKFNLLAIEIKLAEIPQQKNGKWTVENMNAALELFENKMTQKQDVCWECNSWERVECTDLENINYFILVIYV